MIAFADGYYFPNVYTASSTFAIITTVGYGKVAPETDGGKLFLIASIIFGIPFVGLLLAELSKVVFRLFERFTYDQDLWHMNRHSVSEAIFWGSVCCFLPMPFQMIPCLLLCILRRCNIPIAIAVVWISNPITMGPMMYFAYKLGAVVTGQAADVDAIDLSWAWLAERLSEIWAPLIVGCLLCGATMGLIGFLLSHYYFSRRT